MATSAERTATIATNIGPEVVAPGAPTEAVQQVADASALQGAASNLGSELATTAQPWLDYVINSAWPMAMEYVQSALAWDGISTSGIPLLIFTGLFLLGAALIALTVLIKLPKIISVIGKVAGATWWALSCMSKSRRMLRVANRNGKIGSDGLLKGSTAKFGDITMTSLGNGDYETPNKTIIHRNEMASLFASGCEDKVVGGFHISTKFMIPLISENGAIDPFKPVLGEDGRLHGKFKDEENIISLRLMRSIGSSAVAAYKKELAAEKIAQEDADRAEAARVDEANNVVATQNAAIEQAREEGAKEALAAPVLNEIVSEFSAKEEASQ